MNLFLFVVVSALIFMKLISFTGSAPIRDTTVSVLPECPQSPNCVCSQATEKAATIAPIKFAGDSGEAWRQLQFILTEQRGKPGTAHGMNYLRFEFRSRIFGFIDDVECLLNRDESQIEIRSASRAGYYDFGSNRRRVERIRREFEKLDRLSTSPE